MEPACRHCAGVDGSAPRENWELAGILRAPVPGVPRPSPIPQLAVLSVHTSLQESAPPPNSTARVPSTVHAFEEDALPDVAIDVPLAELVQLASTKLRSP